MQTIKFVGYSDDIIYVETAKGKDEYSAQFDDSGTYGGTFNVGKLLVTAFYSPVGTGCWGFGISPVDEGVPIPDWPVRFKLHPKKKYTVVLEIDCPDDERVFYLKESS